MQVVSPYLVGLGREGLGGGAPPLPAGIGSSVEAVARGASATGAGVGAGAGVMIAGLTWFIAGNATPPVGTLGDTVANSVDEAEPLKDPDTTGAGAVDTGVGLGAAAAGVGLAKGTVRFGGTMVDRGWLVLIALSASVGVAPIGVYWKSLGVYIAFAASVISTCLNIFVISMSLSSTLSEVPGDSTILVLSLAFGAEKKAENPFSSICCVTIGAGGTPFIVFILILTAPESIVSLLKWYRATGVDEALSCKMRTTKPKPSPMFSRGVCIYQV